MKPDSGIAKNKSQRQKKVKRSSKVRKVFCNFNWMLGVKIWWPQILSVDFWVTRRCRSASQKKKKSFARGKKNHQCNEKVKSLRTYFTVYNYIVCRVALGWLLINRRQTLSCKTPIWPTFWYLDVVVVGSLLTIGIDYETDKPFFSFKRFPSSCWFHKIAKCLVMYVLGVIKPSKNVKGMQKRGGT